MPDFINYEVQILGLFLVLVGIIMYWRFGKNSKQIRLWITAFSFLLLGNFFFMFDNDFINYISGFVYPIAYGLMYYAVKKEENMYNQVESEYPESNIDAKNYYLLTMME